MARPRDEREAAYFTLLRAREDLDELRRYSEYVAEESRRLRRFSSEGSALAATVRPGLRRALSHTDNPLDEAVTTRLAVLADERERLPARLAGAEAYVEECERHLAALQG